MTEVKVSFYLKRNEEKTDGTIPVLGRIRIGKSMVQFSAKVSVSVKKENVSALDVKNTFQGIASEQDTLVKYYEAHNENFLKSVGVNRCIETYKRYGVSLAHLKRFMRKKYNVSDMAFQALTPSFVADYDITCVWSSAMALE